MKSTDKVLCPWCGRVAGMREGAGILKEQLEQVKREKDAAVRDLDIDAGCETCANADQGCPNDFSEICGNCYQNDDAYKKTRNAYKWRGVCAENGGSEYAKAD